MHNCWQGSGSGKSRDFDCNEKQIHDLRACWTRTVVFWILKGKNMGWTRAAHKKEKEETLRKLAKAPWTGINSVSETNSEDGWLIQTTATVDSKKSYTTDNTYTESGLMKLNITCSQSGLRWSAEGSIKFKETGEIIVFSASDMYEETKNIDGEIISARVTYNNTDANDEDIAMNVRLKLNELMKAMQSSEEGTHYMIKTLTEKSLVLEEGSVLESTGIMMKYKR